MIKRKGLVIITILVISMLALSGCSSTQGSEPSSNSESSEETITVEHLLGETVLNKDPERIIVFDYATLDSLDKMDIEVIGLPKGNLPELLDKFNDDKYEDVGTLFEPNFEKIYELQPDVIFISGRQAEVYDELAEIAPTVYLEVDGAKYMESVTENATILGEIFGKEAFVEEELEKINSAIEQVNEEITKREANALIIMANDGSISAYGEGSRFGIIHEEFGFVPTDPGIEVTNHGQSVTFEYILEKNPEYIFVIDRAATTGGSVSAEQIFDNELIKQTSAYENDKIVYLSSQVWYVASGGLSGTMTMIEDIQSGL